MLVNISVSYKTDSPSDKNVSVLPVSGYSLPRHTAEP